MVKTNLAASRSETILALRQEALRRWDSAALREQVLESQRRRAFLAPILGAQGHAWDYEPGEGAAESYIRNHLPIYEIEKRSRFPMV